jgi:DNA repair exonuclease SbcCD ATPase subunit
MSSLVSQENKELLWALLSEEGLFDGIPENVTPEEIRHVFERILKNLSATIPSLHAAKLKELHYAKQQAIAEEDYDAAKKLRATIDEMEAPLSRLDKLEGRKALAIQAEDFEAAKQIKTEIDRLRAASFSLKELNKIAIESLAVNIPKLARDISAIKLGTRVFPTKTGAGQTSSVGTAMIDRSQNGGVREIYNAEDFQSQKRQEIEMKMREKEAEMRSYFEIPRPPEIDFSDFPREQRIKTRGEITPVSPLVEVVHLDDTAGDTSTIPVPVAGPGPGDDSPFRGGDDMERLIAERIAARQRDMDEITERMKASMPASVAQQQHSLKEYDPNDFVADMPIPPIPPVASFPSEETRKVRFQEDTDSIFLKLKRKPMADE